MGGMSATSAAAGLAKKKNGHEASGEANDHDMQERGLASFGYFRWEHSSSPLSLFFGGFADSVDWRVRKNMILEGLL